MSVERDILARLRGFSRLLRRGIPIEATRISREETPDGPLHTRRRVVLQFQRSDAMTFADFFLSCCGTQQGGIRQEAWLDVIAAMLPTGASDDDVRRACRVRRGSQAAEDLQKVLRVARGLMKAQDEEE